MTLRPRAWALRREDGLSSLELGLVLPVLLLVFAVSFPVIQAGVSYLVLSRASAAGIRYATRADENARPSSDGLTRRPTTAEVAAFVREAGQPLELTSVTVEPEPAGALPGEVIELVASHEVRFGPVASVANGLGSLFFGGAQFLPESKVVTVSARGREE